MAATIADLEVKFSADTKNLSSGVNQAQGLVSGLGGKIGGLATVAGGMVLGGAITAVVGGVGALASAGLNFEKNMANVNSIAQLGAEDIAALSDAVIKIAEDPRITSGPAELAAGLYDIQSSGYSGQEALDILSISAMAGTAGLTTTATASRAVTSALNAFGLGADQATRVSDVMFQTVNKGVLTFDQLANNLGNTMPLANSLGLSIEELGASYALMTLKGVSASQAETQIAGLMRSALNPTDQLTDAMVQYGDGTAEATIANRGMAGYLKVVNKAAGGNKTKMMEMLGTQEAMNAALILGAGDGQEYVDMLDDMTSASEGNGATQDALEKQMESASFKIAEARKQVEILATKLMGALSPAIGFAAQALSGAITSLTDFFGKITGFDDLHFETWLRSLPGFIQPVANFLRDLLNPIGDVVDAFQALREGDFGEAFDEIKEAASGIFDAFVNLGSTLYDNIIGFVQDVDWGGVWDVAVEGIKTAASAGLKLGELAVEGAIKLLGDLGEAKDNLIWWIKKKLGIVGLQGDATGGPNGYESGQSLFGAATQWVVGGVINLIGDLAAAKDRLVDWIKDKLGIGGGIYSDTAHGGGGGGGGTSLFDAATQWLVSGVIEFGGDLLDFGTKIVNKLKSSIDQSEFLQGILASIKEKLAGFSGDKIAALINLNTAGADFGTKIHDAIVKGINQIQDWWGAVDWGKVASTLGTAIADALKLIVGLDIAMWTFMTGVFKGLIFGSGDFGDFPDRIWGAIKAALIGFVGLMTFVDEIIASFVKKLVEATGIGAEDFTGLAESIASAIWDAIKSAASKLSPSMDDVIGWFTDKLTGGGGGGGVQGVKGAKDCPDGQYLDTNTGECTDVGSEPIGLPVKKNAAPSVFQTTFGAGLAGGVDTGFISAIQAMKDRGVAIAASVPPALQGGLNPVIGFVGTIARNTNTGFINPFTPITAQASQIARGTTQGVNTALSPMPQQSAGTGRNTASQLQTALNPMTGQSSTIARNTVTGVGGALAPLPGQANQKGTAAASQFTSGLRSISQATGVAQGATRDVSNALSNASNGAYGYGLSVGQQFAAGISASIPAVSSAVAGIRSLLPSSPAKEGPLKEPVSWDYILDGMVSSFAALAPAAEKAMSGFPVAGGGSLMGPGYAGGGGAVHIDTVVVDIRSWEDLARMMRTLSPQGATTALGISF